MNLLSCRGHGSPDPTVRQAVWLCARVTLGCRVVEDVFAGRGLDISYRTARIWVRMFMCIVAPSIGRRRLDARQVQPAKPELGLGVNLSLSVSMKLLGAFQFLANNPVLAHSGCFTPAPPSDRILPM